MLASSDVERFLKELAEVCARHGVTVIGGFDGRTAAIMRGQPIDLADGRLDRLIEEALRSSDPGVASPETFF
ncbi:hypothetical protein [Humisphaera borealis]|uniref:Uncharacterized protein n=1 Tax=Humisphaera borealis TaxID=2807512 RepID=A0A7M2WW68_9BACT|nr:hypothetical protein [Humisphaera borealis]QOV88740.1 hypothetical protein IPV69_21300 [Humisphaera borealis]